MNQHLVTDRVAVGVVDPLEVVQIQHQQAQCRPEALRPVPLLLEGFPEAVQIGQPRERIGGRDHQQAGAGLFAAPLVNVGERQRHRAGNQDVGEAGEMKFVQEAGMLEYEDGKGGEHEEHRHRETQPQSQQQMGDHRNNVDPQEHRRRGAGQIHRHHHDGQKGNQINQRPDPQIAGTADHHIQHHRCRAGDQFDGGQQVQPPLRIDHEE